jgi:hypothetical protein
MARPHIEFIHAQQLPWQPAPIPEAPWRDLSVKVLSRDPASGACSLIVELPAGFCARGTPEHRPLELYVLDGGCRIADESLRLDAYADFPAGRAEIDIATDQGAVLLAFLGDRPAPGSDAQPSPPRILDTHEMAWTRQDIDPAVQFLNLSHKVLRHDPATGEKTLLLSTGAQAHPRNWREAQLLHHCVEEMYLLGGDIIGERGVMYEGAYFWRPAGIWHGPFGSRRGSLALIRFAAGHHHNVWSDQVREFSLTPAYAPALPPELAARAAQPWLPRSY